MSRALSKLLLDLPVSDETLAADPLSSARRLQAIAARKSATISAGLSLPPGPVGMLTVLPDLTAIWRVQSRLVADIAGVYGKSAALTRESMLYCLFKHGGAALMRDVVVRAGERFVVRPASLRFMEHVLSRIGVRVTQQAIGRSAARWVPLAGALGIGAYAYYDTKRVGDFAIDLFSSEVEIADRSAPLTRAP